MSRRTFCDVCGREISDNMVIGNFEVQVEGRFVVHGHMDCHRECYRQLCANIRATLAGAVIRTREQIHGEVQPEELKIT